MTGVLMAITLVGCAGEDDDPIVALPPVDSERTRDTSSGFPLDSLGDSAADEAPAHTLTMEQWGLWELSPFGGPYTAMVGELRVWEYLDGLRPDSADTALDTGMGWEEALSCQAVLSLVGEPLDEVCATCSFGFAVQITLVDGDPSACRDPDMPQDGEERAWAWDEAGLIWYDYGGSGLWLPWWEAMRSGDSIDFQWTTTVGVVLDEEEDE